jgi:hypothetical protein
MVMNEIAAGWKQNDGRRAASCFTEDAKYSSVPDTRLRQGVPSYIGSSVASTEGQSQCRCNGTT